MNKKFTVYALFLVLIMSNLCFSSKKADNKKDSKKDVKEIIILDEKNDKTKEYKFVNSKIYKWENIMSIVISYQHSLGNAPASLVRSVVINEEDNVILSLKDFLGKEYKNEIYKLVKEEIKKSKDIPFFDNDKEKVEKTDYLNSAIENNSYGYYVKDDFLIIVFDKYSIAPGSVGTIEFKIKNLKSK